MARPEAAVELYLDEQCVLHGATCEKFVSINRRNVPDELVTWPGFYSYEWNRNEPPLIEFVECKAPGKSATPQQKRDHARRRAMGVNVHVINTRELVDQYILSRRDRWVK